MHVGLFYTFRQRFSSLNMDLFENSEDIQELRCLPSGPVEFQILGDDG